MTEETDLYRVLQVDPSADGATLRAAYRRLARQHHPDVTSDVETARRMAEINQAWEVLRDRDRRAAYDARRTAPRSGYVPPAWSTPHQPPAGAARPPGTGNAGQQPQAAPPPGRPEGSVVSFGRYAGWSLGEIARHEPDFLEWLERTPSGRPYRDEIDALLRRLGRRADIADPLARPGRFRA